MADSASMAIASNMEDLAMLKVEKLVNEAYTAQQYSIHCAAAKGDFYESRPWTHKSLMRCFCLWKQSLGEQLPRSVQEILHGLAETFAYPNSLCAIKIFKQTLIAAGTYYTEGIDDDDTEYYKPEQIELRRKILTAEYEKLKDAERGVDRYVGQEESKVTEGSTDKDNDKNKGKHAASRPSKRCFVQEESDEQTPTKSMRVLGSDQGASKTDPPHGKKIKPTKTERGPYTLPPAIANAIIDAVFRNDYEHEKIIPSTDSSGKLRTREELIAAIINYKYIDGRRTLRSWAIKRGFSGRG